MAPSLIHLRSRSVSVVVDVGDGVPAILHWGTLLDEDQVPFELFDRATPRGALDVVAPLSLVPEHGSGFPGRAGLAGHRDDGSGWAPRFGLGGSRTRVEHDATAGSLRVSSSDPVAGLELQIDLALDPDTGVLGLSSTLTNSSTRAYDLDALSLTLPLPGRAREALTIGGRWTREFAPHRHAFTDEAILIENHRGRTSHDRLPAAFTGVEGFDSERGEVWAVHLGWSGNARLVLDPGRDGRRSISAGELLLPGEIQLAPGETYTTPVLYAAHSGEGTNAVSIAYHRHLRARDAHPTTPRPVTLNTWEAVYFDHDLATLQQLADRAAEIGVERFVLDDGWFHARRDDHAGLGDWWVDETVWPNGLTPLIDHVRGLGMTFGLWFEPEMVNPDSELFRAHPEWVLADEGYAPVLGRNQLVLDLARPEVSDCLFDRIDAVLCAHDIAFVKWDMNRDIVHGSHHGRAGVHAQTLALYALLGRIRTAHPGVEIESCSSGGGRTDFAVLESTCRFWTSDCNDALERQHIQRGFSLLFPPELMGAHIGPPRSHTTGRTQTLAFRAVTALFGHLGVEWNLLHTTPEERSLLGELIAFYKDRRDVLHTGTALRFEHPDEGIIAHGVISTDRSDALVSLARVASSEHLVSEPLRVRGLDSGRRYRVELADLALLRTMLFGPARKQPSWIEHGVEATGRQLAEIGLPLPVLHPESAILIVVTTVDR